MDNYDEILKKVSAALAEKGSAPSEKPSETEKQEPVTADAPAAEEKQPVCAQPVEDTSVYAEAAPSDDTDCDTDCEEDEEEDELSLTGWLWRLCIPVVPCIGTIAYIVLLCVWGFGSKPAPSYFKTWAKAALIATLLQVAFFAVILLAVQLSGMDLIGLVVTFLKKVF